MAKAALPRRVITYSQPPEELMTGYGKLTLYFWLDGRRKTIERARFRLLHVPQAMALFRILMPKIARWQEMKAATGSSWSALANIAGTCENCCTPWSSKYPMLLPIPWERNLTMGQLLELCARRSLPILTRKLFQLY